MKPTPLLRILTISACALILRQAVLLRAQSTGLCVKELQTEYGPLCEQCCKSENYVTSWTQVILNPAQGRTTAYLEHANCGGAKDQPCTASTCPSAVDWYEVISPYPACCGGSGDACNAQNGCCSGLVCNSRNACATCVSQHGSCNGGADCCYGICNGGSCCSNLGQSCDTSSDCCGNTYICNNGTCAQPGGGGSPIVLDTFNEGFHLTSLGNGVDFRVLPDGPLQQMSWTDANWHNGWLALDRNGNGTIDNFTELFGNLTPQPPSDTPNGFLALALFDDPANGGNSNGFIDPGDSVYSHLTVWIDANHNGFSEPNELHTLPKLGVSRIGLKYRETPFVDQFGNRFRYKGWLWDQNGSGRDSCYDVFLQIQAK